MTAGDRAVVTVTVAVAPPVAFAVFTTETDLWWRRGPAYRIAGREPGVLRFEPRAGGRLLEEYGSADGPRLYTIGTITVWDPPTRLVFTWRGVNLAEDEATEVEVRFTPSRRGTTVTVEHRGWAAIRDDHPVCHGRPRPAFLAALGGWWGELMTSLRVHLAERP